MYVFTNNQLVDKLLDRWKFDESFEIVADEFTTFYIGHVVYDDETKANVTKYFKVTALTEDTEDTAEEEDVDEDNELLSMEAIEWLHRIGYGALSHSERMAVIKAAKIAYPN